MQNTQKENVQIINYKLINVSIMRKFYFPIILLMIFGATYAQVPTNGLVSFYPFDGNANDESGNGLDGVINGASLTTDRFGNANSAYYFDGIDDNILISNFPMPSKEVTISLWAKTDTIKKQMVFKQLSDDTNRVAASIHYRSTGVTYGDSINIYWDFGNITTGRIYDTIREAKTKVWEHYVFQVSNGNKYMKVFLNNNEVIYDSVAATLQDSIFTLAIGGADYDGIPGGFFYMGSVDNFRVYNRILTPGEIKELYKEGNVTGITATNNNMDFEVYPNPTQGDINIKTKYNGEIKVRITSILGQTTYESKPFNNSYQINLNGLMPTGLNLIQLIDKNNKVIMVKKIIIK